MRWHLQRLHDHRASLPPLAEDLGQTDSRDLWATQAGALRGCLQFLLHLFIDLEADALFLGWLLLSHVGNVGIANVERNAFLLAMCKNAWNVGIMSTTKGRNLGLRLDETDTADLEDFEKGSGIEATTLARNALRACLAYWKQHKKISFPLRLVEAAAESSLPADDATKPSNQKRNIDVEAPQPTEEEKNSNRLDKDSSTIQRVRGSIAAARQKL